MRLSETKAYRERAESCAHQAALTPDPICKKHWEELAREWTAMANSMVKKDVHGKAVP
jgi:hypothetical protein